MRDIYEHYYRCIGSDRWRHLAGPRCGARPVRQDLLDEVVWTEVLRLLEEPALIQQELDRRLTALRAADSKRTRTQAVERDLARARFGERDEANQITTVRRPCPATSSILLSPVRATRRSRS